VRILVTGDWHLDARTAGHDRFDDLRAAVEWTVDLAHKEDVDLYVNLGDLCDPDSTRAHRAIGLACETAARLADFKIGQAWLAGNHDVIEDGTGSTTLAALAGWSRGSGLVGRKPVQPDSFVVAETPVHNAFYLGDLVDVLFLPFTPRAKAYDPVAFVEKMQLSDRCRKLLVFGHLNVIGAEDGSEIQDFPRGREVVFPTDALLSRFGDRCMLFNGHYHRRQIVRGVRMPGALGRLGFGEVGNPAGVLIVEV